MYVWQEGLLHLCKGPVARQDAFGEIVKAVHAVGFEYCSYGVKYAVPVSRQKIATINNYPKEWRRFYVGNKLADIDPSIRLGVRSRIPILWSRDIQDQSRELWQHAKDFGLHHGWTQSYLCPNGNVGMFSVARGCEEISDSELRQKEVSLMWLASVANMLLADKVGDSESSGVDLRLSPRESEVLKWTADGKTSREISEIANLSVDTVNFHMKRILLKLSVPNKTAAVVKAIHLGLFI